MYKNVKYGTWHVDGFHKYVYRTKQHGVNVRVLSYSKPGFEDHHTFYFYWPSQPHERLIGREYLSYV
jgi:O-glycosyl hydrolase